MECFSRIHDIAGLQQSPRVPVKNERKARIIYRTDVNTAVCIFMSVTLQVAVHLGRDCSLNSRSVKNRSSKPVQHFFRTTQKLIEELDGDRSVHDQLEPAYVEGIICAV